jgi:hypothetical protein
MQKNAKLYRNALRGLVAALALGGLQVAHAGYAQLAAPAGYASTSGGHTYAAAANDRIYGRVVHQAGALTANVGGQAVKMPAAYRLAANAPRVAAAVAFAHPGIRTAVGIAAWLASAYFVWDAATGTWRKVEDKIGGQTLVWIDDGKQYTTARAACQAAYNRTITNKTLYPFAGAYVRSNGIQADCKNSNSTYPNWEPDIFSGVYATKVEQPLECPDGTTSTPAGCLSPPLTQPEFVEEIAAKPMPSTVPQELPYPTPLPVEQPFINPAPGENPSNRPQRVPTGQPIPIPNTDPQQWRQPYVDIVPAPTPDSPWRVDVKPGEVESPNPNPAENPNPDTDTDKPTEEQDKSLCEKHPEILACSKPELDVPDGEIPKLTKQITYAEEGGFGGGSCPSNVYANLHGKQTMVYEWTRTCSVVSTYIRPIILLLGAMGALFILIPGRDS